MSLDGGGQPLLLSITSLVSETQKKAKVDINERSLGVSSLYNLLQLDIV
jgi:hypothetical protein